MYLPAKPDKYHLKIISICDAKTFYFYSGIPYIGKETRNQNNLLIPTQYVLKLVEPIREPTEMSQLTTGSPLSS